MSSPPTALLAVSLALTWRITPEPDATQPTTQPEEGRDSTRRAGFRALRLRVDGIPFDELRAELSLRLPEVPILQHVRAQGSTLEEPYVFADVQAVAEGRFRLTVITSDLDAYHREIEARDQAARIVASTIANLLFAIEAESVEPDQVDVAIPPPEDDTAAVEPSDEEHEPATEEIPEESRPPEPAPAVRPSPRTWEFGPTGGAGVLVGLAPTGAASALAGWGGGLALDVRSPSGALLALGLRAVGRSAHEHRLTRIRVAVGGGYAWRWGSFELPVAMAASVEPWFVTRDGASTGIEQDGAARRPRPLLGIVARLSPGYRVTLRRGRLLALRFGPRLELSGSFLVDEEQGATAATITAVDEHDERVELFRLGGLELHAGLELALWLGVRDRHAAVPEHGKLGRWPRSAE